MQARMAGTGLLRWELLTEAGRALSQLGDSGGARAC